MWLVLWTGIDGSNGWDFVPESDLAGLLERLDAQGVPRTSVAACFMPGTFRWAYPSADHSCMPEAALSGLVNGHRDPAPERRPAGPGYGWLAPDGRFLRCDYGGHSELADRIAGLLDPVDDPEIFLESKGWARIHADPSKGRGPAISMADGAKLSDRQLEHIIRTGVKYAGISAYL